MRGLDCEVVVHPLPGMSEVLSYLYNDRLPENPHLGHWISLLTQREHTDLVFSPPLAC